MKTFCAEQQTLQWRRSLEHFDIEVRQQTKTIAVVGKQELATFFYQQMLADQDSRNYLNHDDVKTRLHGSMQQWIVNLFTVGAELENLEQAVAVQHHVGEVHARIGIPVHLVMRGARALKSHLSERLSCSEAKHYVHYIIDVAIEIMSHAYSHSHERNARAEEAYRLFSVAENVASEKQRQRAALLDWENQFMFEKAMGVAQAQLPRIQGSEFGLWFRHKGAHAFEGVRETTLIQRAMMHIDEEIVPVLGDLSTAAEDPMALLRELREHCKSIAFHLEYLFDQNDALEAGRDALTRLLNRKFLPVVMSKQIATAQKSKSSFAVLTVDIDHFKAINDTHGHEAGDSILQQVATRLMNHSRAGDYVFRMGGEEFLIVLVDVNGSQAMKKSTELCALIAAEPFHITGGEAVEASVSIGVSVFDGHPDYQKLLRESDDALYRAKGTGRNKVVLAAS